MTICNAILTPVVVLVRTFIQVVRDVVRTVCEWVSSVVRTVRTVVERICSWLPWPLSDVCNLVTKVIEVFETVWDWFCHEVIERVIDWIERIVEYITYILRWVCWVVSWIFRGPALLLCAIGVKPQRFLNVCIRVLTDDESNPATTWEKVEADVRQAADIFRRCNIELVVSDRARVAKAAFLDGTTCDFSGMFTDFFTWFAANECSACSSVTVYYVRSIPGAIGCAYPGSNWVTVAAGGNPAGDGRTMVQEIGHLCDLWAHSSDPNNVMTDDQGGGTADQITASQCCMIRTSRFATGAPCLQAGPIEFDRVQPLLQAAEAETSEEAAPLARHSHGFQALHQKTPGGSSPVLVSRVAQALLAGVLLARVGRALTQRLRGSLR